MFTISLKSGDLETIHEMYSHTYTNLELPGSQNVILTGGLSRHMKAHQLVRLLLFPVSFVLWPRAKIFFQEVGENMALEGF